jgi:hypothetical protein
MSKSRRRDENPATPLVRQYLKESLSQQPRTVLLKQMTDKLSSMRSASPSAIIEAVREAAPCDPEAASLATLIQALDNPRLDAALQEFSLDPQVAAMLARLGRKPMSVEALVAEALQTGLVPQPCPPRLALAIMERLDPLNDSVSLPMLQRLAHTSEPNVRAMAAALLVRCPGTPQRDSEAGYMDSPCHGKRRLNLACRLANGRIRVVGFLCSDDRIVDKGGVLEIDQKEWRQWRQDYGFVRCPASYIRWRMHAMANLTLSFSPEFRETWETMAVVVGESPIEVPSHPVYDRILASSLTPHDWASGATLLGEVDEAGFLAWADEIVENAASELPSAEERFEERHERLARAALQRTPAIQRTRLALQVEDLAYVLSCRGKATAARKALAAAVALNSSCPLDEIPFILELMKYSIALVVEHMVCHSNGT